MSASKFKRILILAALVVLTAASTADAHVGVGPAHDVLHGLEHPLTGVDHLFAMVAVGMWAVQRGGRAVWIMPLAFVLVMAIGGALGMAGVSIPFVEPGIAASLMVFGLLVATATQLRVAASAAIVAAFALLHGHAHGAEIPLTATAASYAAGFIFATAMLHAVGITFGVSMQRLNQSRLVRTAGAAIALCGVWLMLR